MRYVAVLLVLIAALAGCQKPPPEYESRYTPPPPEPQAIPVAVIGDSYTGGSAMGGNGIKGWPALAESKLRKDGLDVVMRVGAEGGSGYAKPGNAGTVFGDRVPSTIGGNTKLVVMFGSANDAAIPAPELTDAVQRTLAEVKRLAPKAGLLVIGPAYTQVPNPGMLQARDIVRAQAQAVGAVFVDPFAENWFVGQPQLVGTDDGHPNDAGHEFMASKIAPLIAQQLQQASPPRP